MKHLFCITTAYGKTYVVAEDYAEAEKKFEKERDNRFTEVKSIEVISTNIIT